jgi:hypothetical protein
VERVLLLLEDDPGRSEAMLRALSALPNLQVVLFDNAPDTLDWRGRTPAAPPSSSWITILARPASATTSASNPASGGSSRITSRSYPPTARS